MKYSLRANRRLSLNSGVVPSAGQEAGLPKRMANGLLAGLAALAIVWWMQSGPAEAQAVTVAGVSATQPRAVTVLDLEDWSFVQDDSLTDAAALSSDLTLAPCSMSTDRDVAPCASVLTAEAMVPSLRSTGTLAPAFTCRAVASAA